VFHTFKNRLENDRKQRHNPNSYAYRSKIWIENRRKYFTKHFRYFIYVFKRFRCCAAPTSTKNYCCLCRKLKKKCKESGDIICELKRFLIILKCIKMGFHFDTLTIISSLFIRYGFSKCIQ